ncbi:hypothetical protein PR048_020759 [Dryococelus australis]|uniref:DDE-1 domain-containing protein n=1 Tax=Dryococelus australis TaxID=614101 RepID=A0ABQ9GWC6_9NEOP|nr:hypothetical protein PR048_020759 [Dryococelus australis]
MIAATEDVKADFNSRNTAEKNGVSRNTLTDRIKGNTPAGRKMGPDSWLPKEKEEIKFCDEHGRFILVALLPNATHILQPMDVGVSRSLKNGWKKDVHEWQIQQVLDGKDTTLKKEFAKLLDTAINNSVCPEQLQNAFPSDVWNGDIKDIYLFEFWKHMTSLVTAQPGTGVNSATSPSGYSLQVQLRTPLDVSPSTSHVLPSASDSVPLASADLPVVKKNTCRTLSGKIIPSPFKWALFWPGPQKHKICMKAPKQKIPTIVSSKALQEYYSRKETIKREEEQIEEEGKLKETKDDPVPLESSDERSNQHEEEIITASENMPEDNALARVTILDGKREAPKYRYVCIIQEIHGKDLKVLGMRQVDKTKKVFITKDDDISSINRSQVDRILPTPEMNATGARVCYILK